MIFITGANGFVGSYIARKFLQAGYPVKASIRPNSSRDLIQDIDDQIMWVEGDILDISFLSEHIQGVDYVIHAAAYISYAPEDKPFMYQVNVDGTANVVNACLKNKVKKLCHLSSVAALGMSQDKKNIDEKHPWQESDLNTNYAQTKHLAELEVWRGKAEGLNMVILNPSIVIGPGDWDRSSTQIFKYVWKEKKYYTEGKINYVDVRDVADIAYRLCLSPVQSERFIVNAGLTTYQAFLNQVADHLARKKPTQSLSPFLANFAWRFAQAQSLITGKPPFITQDAIRVARKTVHYPSDKLRNKLDFQFHELDDTIKWTCQELIKKYHLK